MLPEDLRAPTDEVAWLEPYPDTLLDGIADDAPGPEVLYDQREATELAFVRHFNTWRRGNARSC